MNSVTQTPAQNEQSMLDANQHYLRIEPSRGWRALKLVELWQYRELLWLLTSRDLKGRYRQMALGPLWIVLKPLLNMIIFSLIFGNLANLPSDGIPYPVFNYTALLPWTYFAGAAGSAAGSLVSRMNIISKVYFPRLVVPLSAVISGLIDMIVSFSVLLILMLMFSVQLSWTIIFLPFFVLLAAASALAIGLWSATIAVRFRDLQFAVQYAIQAGMYLSPVVYSASLVPEKWLWLYQLNPMFWVIEGFRWAIMGKGTAPQPYMLVSVTLVLILLIAGLFIFRRTERIIVDWL